MSESAAGGGAGGPASTPPSTEASDGEGAGPASIAPSTRTRAFHVTGKPLTHALAVSDLRMISFGFGVAFSLSGYDVRRTSSIRSIQYWRRTVIG